MKVKKTTYPDVPVTILSLKAEYRKKLKIESAKQEKSMTSIIEELIKTHL